MWSFINPSPLSLSDNVGFVDYNDAATQTTPINLGLTAVPLTNDGAGAFTTLTYGLSGVPIWSVANQQFEWTGLKLGDTVDFRLDVEVTTGGPNREIVTEIDLAIGSGSDYTLFLDRRNFKNAGSFQFTRWSSIYMGDANTLNNPAKFAMFSDSATGDSVKVNGWYCRVIRR